MATNVKKVVHLKSSVLSPCQVCTEGIDTGGRNDHIAAAINHYLQHGYKLLHVGQETEYTPEGQLYQATVAVLGK
jgi:hypothetical protein